MVLIYTCRMTGVEVVSDAFPIKENEGEPYFSVQSTEFTDNDEYSDTAGQKLIDVVKTFDYCETSYTKKTYVGYFKLYLKGLLAWFKENKPDEVAQFQKDAGVFMKFFLSQKKDDLGFWMTEANSSEGFVPWGYWKPNSPDPPVFVYFKHAFNVRKA